MLFLPLSGHPDSSIHPLQLNISTAKNTYRIGDTIKFMLTFTNRTKEDRYIYFDGLYNAHLFNVTGKSGIKAPFVGKVIYDVMWSKEHYKLIKSGGNFKCEIKAEVRKDKGIVIDFKDSLIEISHPGKYKIFVSYEGWDGITTDKNGEQIEISDFLGLKNVFTNELVSNTILREIK